jgi:hypothetical protein
LTINMVVHRANIGRIEPMVELALSLGASRVEVAHVQYYGWAMKNRAALMPSRAQVDEAVRQVEMLRARHHGRIVIDAVVPDYFARFPKPCVGGWGRRSLNVTPAGKVLPCHAAEVIPGLEFWHVREHSLGEIWRESPAFNAFRGESWILAAAAARPFFSLAMHMLPIRFAISRRSTRSLANWRSSARIWPTATGLPDRPRIHAPRLQPTGEMVETCGNGGRAPAGWDLARHAPPAQGRLR